MRNRLRNVWHQARWQHLLVVVVMILGLVTYLNVTSHRTASQGNQTGALLRDLDLLLHQESSLQWKTLADRSAPVRVAREVGTIRGRERAILDALAKTLPRKELTEVRRLVDAYHTVLDDELAMIIVSLTEDAKALEVKETEPRFIAVSERLSELSRSAVVDARRSARTADTTLIGTMLLTSLLIGALLRRFDQAHRTAARASAELLRQERNALAQAQESAEIIRHQAAHDALTGLPNRTLFTERVEAAMSGPGDPAVLFIDIDDFKRVNDSLGHTAGDRLLSEVSDLLRDSVRDNDTAARLGGDEFAVLIEDGGTDAAVSVAERVITALGRPIDIGGTQVLTHASVGVAVVGAARVAADLLRDADLAMYAAKKAGKGQYAVFRPSMHDRVRNRVGLEADLRRDLDAGRLHLAYQPVVSLADGEIVGAEALVRWDHPVEGPLSPAVFLPLAEESGLILPLGRWVVGEACRQAAQWMRERPDAPFAISVNLSPRQLHHRGVVEEVCAALRTTGLDPDALVLEITESAIVEDDEAVAARLHEWRAMGVHVALDDFGTGYSSLSHLQRFPVDQVKVDRSFVATADKIGMAILRLAESLDLDTVAEGIEIPEQADWAHSLGCRLGQGYWFARPVRGEAFTELWRRGAPLPAADVPAAA